MDLPLRDLRIRSVCFGIIPGLETHDTMGANGPTVPATVGTGVVTADMVKPK
jgi:hypothetical protein